MKGLLSSALVLVAVALAGCTVHQTEAPGFSGPSDLALSMKVTALPDSISQDGGSQSSIQVTAFGPDGKPKSGLSLRMDMMVEGKPQDFGTLSGRTIVTNSSGVASVIYTAPPSPVAGIFGTCQGLAGNCVTIVATPSGTGFETANPQSVTIRLVPIGVIQPSDGPVPSFTFTPTAPAANSPVQFDASASCGGPLVSGACPGTRGIVSYSWNFGDGSTATGRTASHSFASQRSYTVILTITNDLGASVSKSNVVTVGAGSGPTVDFVFSPSAPVVNQSVNFDASQARPGPGHTIASYAWNFGDGSTKTGVTATHDFGTAGAFNVTLTVTDEAGQATTVAKSVPVTVSGGSGGGGGGTAASFVASPTAPVVGQIVFFNASGSTAATGHTLTKYQWDFGDGTTFIGSTSSATHTFTTVGTFSVGLIVTDDTGQIAKFTGTVTVAPAGTVAPSARFTSSPSGPGVNQDVFFNASSSTAAPGHTLTTYAWDFGDGSNGSGVTVTHAYARAGNFTVTLVVTDDVGQIATSSAGVTVVANSSQIVADFNFSPTDPSLKNGTNQVFFDATASSSPSGIVSYVWDFGDGSAPGAGQKPNHTYTLPATYVVRLTVTDGAGRTATTTKTVTVAAP